MTGYRSGGGRCWVNAMEMENLSCSACMGKQSVTEEADQERRVGEQRAPAQSAAELVAGSVQLLHPHRATTPSLVPQREGGTSGSHNGNYLQPHWGNDEKMLLTGETAETHWREGEREDWHEEGEWWSREEETWGWPLPSMWLRQNRLGESKRSDLISRQGAFLRVCRGNSVCHKNGTNVGSE